MELVVLSWLVFSYYSYFLLPKIRSAGEHTKVSAGAGLLSPYWFRANPSDRGHCALKLSIMQVWFLPWPVSRLSTRRPVTGRRGRGGVAWGGGGPGGLMCDGALRSSGYTHGLSRPEFIILRLLFQLDSCLWIKITLFTQFDLLIIIYLKLWTL